MWAFLATPLGKGILYFLTVVCAVAFLVFCFKIWITLHDRQVLSGYVLLTEKTAADARIKDLEAQVGIAQKANEDIRKAQMADDLRLQASEAQNDQDITEYEKRIAALKRSCFADADDAKFLSNH